MRTDIRQWLTESANIEPDVTVNQEDQLIENSLQAFEYLQQFNTLNKQRIETAHFQLMQDSQPDIAGSFRDKQVYIGSKPALPPEKIDKELGIILTTKKEPENGLEAVKWHIDFEQIHPFADGNGRIGRIIYLWHCDQLDIEPLHLGGRNVEAYFDLFP